MLRDTALAPPPPIPLSLTQPRLRPHHRHQSALTGSNRHFIFNYPHLPMNPEPQILNLANAPESSSAPENSAGEALLHFEHRGNGKVARLPKPVRDQVNQMLLNGLSYAAIIERLGDPGKNLSPDNIGEWKKRGYRDWLLQQEWLDRMASKSNFSADILSAPETSNLHEAGLRFAAAQMFDQLMRFNAVLDSPDSPDTADKFARLVNALSRLNRAALSFKKYADVRADLKEKELKLLDPNRTPDNGQCAALARAWDRHFLGANYKSPTDYATPTPGTLP